MISGLGRGYVLRARTQPALLVALPFLAFLLYLRGDPIIGVAIPVVSVLGVVAFTNEIVRGRGRHLEKRLIRKWGGLPTTARLRWSGGKVAALRRSELERFVGVELPTEEDERADPAEADRAYADAVKMAIEKLGRNTLLQTENIGYGFRRNMLAWKSVEFWLIALAAILNFSVGWWSEFPTSTYFVWSAHGLALLAWIFFVNEAWVRDQAESYADQFFAEVRSSATDNVQA